MNIQEIMSLFLKTSLTFAGKEVCLPSNQHFNIDQILDENNDEEVFDYVIQYGYPQSGCVSAHIRYLKRKCAIEVTKFDVYAQPADQQIMMSTFTPEEEIGELTIKASFGMDLGTIKHSTTHEIEDNPNAITTIKMAINDIAKAEVLGECMVAVPNGSDRIPCTISTTKKRSLGV